jgi:hypothetical protein
MGGPFLVARHPVPGLLATVRREANVTKVPHFCVLPKSKAPGKHSRGLDVSIFNGL